MMRLNFILIGLFLFSGLGHQALAQKSKKANTYLKLYYEDIDGQAFLVAELKAKVKKKFVRIADAELSFKNENDTAKIDLGKVKTNENGSVRLAVPKDMVLLQNAEGKYPFAVSFRGNESYKKRKTSAEITPVRFDFDLAEGEENNIVTVTAFKSDTVPLDGAKVEVLVKRSFAWHKLGDGNLSEGKLEVEVPAKLPSAQGALLTIACRLDQEGTGKVLRSKQANWGAEPLFAEKPVNRAKWSYLLFMAVSISLAYLLSIFLKRIF